jgi:hypothetical protein
MAWDQVGVMVGVLASLVGVPLGMITLYLRAIREQQTATTAEISRRIHIIEDADRGGTGRRTRAGGGGRSGDGGDGGDGATAGGGGGGSAGREAPTRRVCGC